jgi:hypothetical protein
VDRGIGERREGLGNSGSFVRSAVRCGVLRSGERAHGWRREVGWRGRLVLFLSTFFASLRLACASSASSPLPSHRQLASCLRALRLWLPELSQGAFSFPSFPGALTLILLSTASSSHTPSPSFAPYITRTSSSRQNVVRPCSSYSNTFRSFPSLFFPQFFPAQLVPSLDIVTLARPPSSSFQSECARSFPSIRHLDNHGRHPRALAPASRKARESQRRPGRITAAFLIISRYLSLRLHPLSLLESSKAIKRAECKCKNAAG